MVCWSIFIFDSHAADYYYLWQCARDAIVHHAKFDGFSADSRAHNTSDIFFCFLAPGSRSHMANCNFLICHFSFCLQASGVTVSDVCKTTYEEIKKDKKHRYVIFYIRDEKQIDVEFIGGRDAEYEQFLQHIQEGGSGECRWVDQCPRTTIKIAFTRIEMIEMHVYAFHVSSNQTFNRFTWLNVCWLAVLSNCARRLIYLSSMVYFL